MPGYKDRLTPFRAFYASLITSQISDEDTRARLRWAFETIPRELYCGPGPWKAFSSGQPVITPSDDPAFLYQDIVVSIDEERGINNGQPTLHAISMAALRVSEGETIVQVGAGTGYYSAVLAALAGERGVVIGYEIEPDLAAQAKTNLAAISNVEIRSASGTDAALPACDVIYVNAGATDPLPVWLDALRPGGRLLFPLTPDKGFGAMLLATKPAEGKQMAPWEASFVSPASFIPCAGGRNAKTSAQLSQAFARRDYGKVQSLHRDNNPDKTCWVSGGGWWLSTSAE